MYRRYGRERPVSTWPLKVHFAHGRFCPQWAIQGIECPQWAIEGNAHAGLSGVQGGDGGVGEQAYAGGDGALVHVEGALVQVELLAGPADAEAAHRTRDVLQIPGEVLAAHALRRTHHRVSAQTDAAGL